jgi:shikimate dehydrogenase
MTSYYGLQQFKKLSGGKSVYAVIGNPIGHSMSAPLHKLLSEGGEYSAVLIDGDEELKDFCRYAKINLAGFNVTIPYKKDIIKYLDKIRGIAKKTQSVNTVKNENGLLVGYNTDIYGIERALKYNGVELSGKSALILGGGGAASAAATALSKKAEVTIAVRDKEKAKKAFSNYNVIGLNEISGGYDLIINCTPCGMKGQEDTSAIEITGKNYGFIYDMVYNPLKTKLIKQAENFGIKCSNGLTMLIFQAIKARRIWGDKIRITRRQTENIENALKAQVLRQRLDGKGIALCGFMGSGKTTVAQYMQKKYGIQYTDTDALIEKRCGKKIKDIFKQCGESGFREIESEVICGLNSDEFNILSLGGGSVLMPQNAEHIKRRYFIIYIDIPLGIALKRTNDGSRPLLSQSYDQISRLYEERKSVYKNISDYTVDGTKSTEKICGEIINI